VVLADKTADNFNITGLERALEQADTDIRIFGKPTTRPYRRMGVALVYDQIGTDMIELRKKAKDADDYIAIT